MKLFLVLLSIIGISLNAAEVEVPEVAKMGNADAGSELVATCCSMPWRRWK